ncbi:uncharacterized protein LOC142337014 isoform X2 [Convolutriloba macropyga]
MFDIMDSQNEIESDINNTFIELSRRFRPMTHYRFHIRSSSQCHGNGSKTYSDWVNVDVYTRPLKPVVEVLETGLNYAVVDVHSWEVYDSISIYMNDLKQAPEPSAWPHMIKNLNGIVQYRISIEVSKYGQSATSDEILLELPTLAPTTVEPEVETNITSWAVVAGVVLLLLSAILYGQFKERLQIKRSATTKRETNDVYADARYMEPNFCSNKPCTSTSADMPNTELGRFSGLYDQTEDEDVNQFVDELDDNGDVCSKHLEPEEMIESSPPVLNPRASQKNEYLEPRVMEIVVEEEKDDRDQIVQEVQET